MFQPTNRMIRLSISLGSGIIHTNETETSSSRKHHGGSRPGPFSFAPAGEYTQTQIQPGHKYTYGGAATHLYFANLSQFSRLHKYHQTLIANRKGHIIKFLQTHPGATVPWLSLPTLLCPYPQEVLLPTSRPLRGLSGDSQGHRYVARLQIAYRPSPCAAKWEQTDMPEYGEYGVDL